MISAGAIITKLEKEADDIYKCYVSSKKESLKKELNDMLKIYFRQRLIEEGLLMENNIFVFELDFDIEMSNFQLSYESIEIGGKSQNKKQGKKQ